MVAKNPTRFSSDNRFGPYTIIDRASGLVIGGAGFIGPPAEDGTVEIGYGIAAEWRNRGIATEAVHGLLQFAWSQPGVERVFATTDPSNASSARVLEKAGMSFVRMQGTLKYYEIVLHK
jgi:RimJ/RimL family protein N-acetyltransferase